MSVKERISISPVGIGVGVGVAVDVAVGVGVGVGVEVGVEVGVGVGPGVGSGVPVRTSCQFVGNSTRYSSRLSVVTVGYISAA